MNQSGISVIMLNHATILTDAPNSAVIAWSSAASYIDVNENQSWSNDEPKGPFPVAVNLRAGKGTVAIISDPSIIISSMVGKDENYQFIRYLTSNDSEILIDRSHLSKTPLDVSKIKLLDARAVLSNPYALVGITALIFVVVSRYTLWKGETIG